MKTPKKWFWQKSKKVDENYVNNLNKLIDKHVCARNSWHCEAGIEEDSQQESILLIESLNESRKFTVNKYGYIDEVVK